MSSVDSYVLHYRARGQQAWHTRTVLVPPVDKPSTEKVRRIPPPNPNPDPLPPTQMLLSNLTTNTEYELYTQALTSSLYKEDLTYPGLTSETHTLTVNRSLRKL